MRNTITNNTEWGEGGSHMLTFAAASSFCWRRMLIVAGGHVRDVGRLFSLWQAVRWWYADMRETSDAFSHCGRLSGGEMHQTSSYDLPVLWPPPGFVPYQGPPSPHPELIVVGFDTLRPTKKTNARGKVRNTATNNTEWGEGGSHMLTFAAASSFVGAGC